MKITLVRTSLVVAIVTGVTVSGIQMTQLKKKIATFRAVAITQTAAREKAGADLTILRRESDKNTLALKQTTEALTAKNAETTAQAQQIAKLNIESEKLRKERDDAQSELAAYRVSMPSPDQVAHAARRIKSLEDSLAAVNEENGLLARRIKTLQKSLPTREPCQILLPADLRAKVLAVDPKWRFVVLDAGEDQGVLSHGELLLSRGGKLVARVLVRNVEKNSCVADLMKGWDIAEMMEVTERFRLILTRKPA